MSIETSLKPLLQNNLPLCDPTMCLLFPKTHMYFPRYGWIHSFWFWYSRCVCWFAHIRADVECHAIHHRLWHHAFFEFVGYSRSPKITSTWAVLLLRCSTAATQDRKPPQNKSEASHHKCPLHQLCKESTEFVWGFTTWWCVQKN